MAKDIYSQIGYISVTESAATTLTFNGLTIATNVLQQSGMLIHKVEYEFPAATKALLVANGDALQFGLAGSDSLTSINLSSPEVYDENQVYQSQGAAGLSIDRYPVIKDFGGLPGGGRLVPADRLYGFILGVSIASAATVTIRFHFTILDLSPQEYIELAQSLRVLR